MQSFGAGRGQEGDEQGFRDTDIWAQERWGIVVAEVQQSVKAGSVQHDNSGILERQIHINT